MSEFDLVIKSARVVRPRYPTADAMDIGIKGGRFARLAPEIQIGRAHV